MRPISVETLANLLGGALVGVEMSQVYGFATDTREVRAGDAFLAIRGARVDAHDLVGDAYAAGAVVAIVERPVNGPYILVDGIVDALARLASKLRDTFDGPVIGITGSAGKTTTKEFIAAALRPLGKILKTTGNRNTEYTSPLLWGDLETDTEAVVVEMAMRGFGQIAHLAAFTLPTIGVITNIGFGHMEMVGSREGIVRAKAELIEALPSDGTAVLWAEDDYFAELQRIAGETREVASFGFSAAARCRVLDYRLEEVGARIVGTVDGHEWVARLPIIGRHIATNAAAAVLVAHLCGVDPAVAGELLGSAELPKMRMEVRKFHGATLLIDTYNASPPAMIAAIETLMEMNVPGSRRAVIGEMKELGEQTEALHRSIGRALAKLDSVLFYGDSMTTFAREEAERAGLADAQVATSIEGVRHFLQSVRPGDAVLVKGSRALELERALVEEAVT